ncbi:hypothetical protein VN97_g7376 [Penicillium thymicola]|uniref:Uncharacterized protein n=1 Tax=Penicillium thymicola TaxID=293382 RepID=A0AAI9TGH1_PENTH|nr:hypothetical protein VN97_g7376 [Penicillium thymicola]
METEKDQSKFLGACWKERNVTSICLLLRAHGLLGNLDPHAGQICYKDGAATGRTAGTIGQTEALVSLKRKRQTLLLQEQRRLMLTNPNSLRSISFIASMQYVRKATQDAVFLCLFPMKMATCG